MKHRKKLIFSGLTVALTLGLAGAAFAYFTSSGTGTGSAGVGTPAALTVTSSTAIGALFPGGAPLAVTVNVENPGPATVQVSTFTISIANTDDSAWTSDTTAFPTEGACTAADFTLGTNTAPGSYTVDTTIDPTLPASLAAGDTYTATVSLAMLDTGIAQDNCQGVTVPLYIAAK